LTAKANPLERAVDLLRLADGRLRARFLAIRGARVGRKVSVGARCIVLRPGGLELGERCVLEPEAYLKLVTDSAFLALGADTFVGRGVQFDVAQRITVGEHCLFAPRCFITDHGHGTRAASRIDQQECPSAPVVIGSDVWLGYGVVVLPGVTIGDGAVIGANSVVNRDVEAMSVVAGSPAKFVRMRDS